MHLNSQIWLDSNQMKCFKSVFDLKESISQHLKILVLKNQKAGISLQICLKKPFYFENDSLTDWLLSSSLQY